MIDLSYLVSFDTETTGVDVLNDRVVTTSIAYIDPVGNIIDNWEWLINPGVEIPEGAAAVHGITTEFAQANGQPAPQAIYEIAGILGYFLNNGVPVVAYNAAFDFSLINAEINRHLHLSGALSEFLNNPNALGLAAFLNSPENLKYIIDPYIIDLRLDKWRKGSRTLTAAATHYRVDLENAHTSFDDCVAAAGVARGLWDKYALLTEGNYEDLFDLQVDWYREIMDDRRVYFAKQGKEMTDFSNVWPIRTS